ncbi:DUF2631 domain-containing protein [Amycolatopsis sp. cmx-11-51]|uniref:DUF2631 domain-containing protein n=1 Tax=unclassified Amycolatopsis TaxID=2618356 RepID=UPI0039E3BCBB
MASKAVEKRGRVGVDTVDPRDEPSAEWGWHGSFPKATRIAGWLSAIILLVMLYGNHHGWTEDLWLIGLSLTLVFGLVLDMRKQRTAWRK